MAKKDPKRGGSGGNGGFHGFVNFSLGRTDKENIRNMVDDGIDPLPALQEVVEAGYSIKVGWDDYSSCLSAMLFGTTCKNGNAGWGMSCRHTDLAVALLGLLYQHRELSGEDNEWPKPSDIASEHDW